MATSLRDYNSTACPSTAGAMATIMAYTAELRGCVEVERWEGLPSPPLNTVMQQMFVDPPLELTAVFHANSTSIVEVEIFVAFVAG